MDDEENISSQESQVEKENKPTQPKQDSALFHLISDSLRKFENKRLLFLLLTLCVVGGSIYASNVIYSLEKPLPETKKTLSTEPVPNVSSKPQTRYAVPAAPKQEVATDEPVAEPKAVEEPERTTLTEYESRLIAESTCIKGGEALSKGTYNENTQTWRYDVHLSITKEGCKPSCVVAEATKTAEIDWRCTDTILPPAQSLPPEQT